jgi:hypothetical protein
VQFSVGTNGTQHETKDRVLVMHTITACGNDSCCCHLAA